MRFVAWRALVGGMVACGLLFACSSPTPPGFGNDDDEDDTGDDDTTQTVVTGVIFTEIMANPARVSDADGEWIEIYNLGDEEVDLNGWTITDASGAIITIADVVIAPEDYVVLGNNPETLENGGVSLQAVYTDLTIGNDDETLTLADEDGKQRDVVSWTVAYNGASISLDPKRYDPAQNDDPDNFCAAKSKIGSGDLGTPGLRNDVCFVVATEGDLVITEIMANPTTSVDEWGEYIEIYNASAATIDLSGWVVEDPIGDRHTISPDSGELLVSPRSLVVLGSHFEKSENGGVDLDYSWGKDIILDNTSGEVKLLAGQTEVDVVEYGGVGFPATSDGASIQLDPEKLDATLNDNGANWCLSTDSLSGGGLGSPGDSNASCGS